MTARSIGQVAVFIDSNKIGNANASQCIRLSDLIDVIVTLIDDKTDFNIHGHLKGFKIKIYIVILGCNNRMINIIDLSDPISASNA